MSSVQFASGPNEMSPLGSLDMLILVFVYGEADNQDLSRWFEWCYMLVSKMCASIVAVMIILVLVLYHTFCPLRRPSQPF